MSTCQDRRLWSLDQSTADETFCRANRPSDYDSVDIALGLVAPMLDTLSFVILCLCNNSRSESREQWLFSQVFDAVSLHATLESAISGASSAEMLRRGVDAGHLRSLDLRR